MIFVMVECVMLRCSVVVVKLFDFIMLINLVMFLSCLFMLFCFVLMKCDDGVVFMMVIIVG